MPCVHIPSSQQSRSRWGWPLRQDPRSLRRSRPTEARSDARRRHPTVEPVAPRRGWPSPGARSRLRLRVRQSGPLRTWRPRACRAANASSSILVLWNSAAAPAAAATGAAVVAAPPCVVAEAAVEAKAAWPFPAEQLAEAVRAGAQGIRGARRWRGPAVVTTAAAITRRRLLPAVLLPLLLPLLVLLRRGYFDTWGYWGAGVGTGLGISRLRRHIPYGYGITAATTRADCGSRCSLATPRCSSTAITPGRWTTSTAGCRA